MAMGVGESKERVEEEYQDGSIYYGEKLNGLRHGYGKFSYADGGVYEGEWQFGTMEGYGKLFYPSENLAYEGEWKRNAFNGNGKVYNEEPSDHQVGNRWERRAVARRRLTRGGRAHKSTASRESRAT